MKTKCILSMVVAGFCFLSLPAFASTQEGETNRDENGKIVKGPYLTTHISNNWFIDVAAGPSYYFGGLDESNIAKGICPVINLAVGKWLTPEIAVRISGNYTPKFKQFYNGANRAPAGLTPGQELNFYYYSVHADFMWDLLTSFGGYKWNRVYHVIPFVGAGYSQLGASNYFPSVSHEFSLHGGVINKFRLCNWCDFNIEIYGSAANNHFDRIEQWSSTTADIVCSVTGGFTFNINNKSAKRASTYAAAAVAEKEAALAALAAAKAATDAQNTALIKEVETLKAAKPDTVVITKANGPELAEVVVFFNIDKATLTPQESYRFDTFVYYIKSLVANGETVTLIGSCDKQTGTSKYNDKLSKKRVDMVKKMLVEEYGIPADKLVTVAEGGSNNRFKVQQLNRCVYVKIK